MKKLLALMLAGVLSLGLAGCASTVGNEKSEVKEERVLRIDGDNLGYPSVYTSSPRGRGYMMVSYIFDTLVWKDEEGNVPMLAESWSVSEDNITYIFNLVEGVTFTDNEPLTAEDVKFSFEYLKEHPYQWISVDMVKEIRVIDAQTVEIELNDIYVPFITDVAGNVPIIPKHIWENVEEPEKFNTAEAVIGSGPFKLEHFDDTMGTYIYVANENYFMGELQIDRLIVSPVENTKEALIAGEIDMAVKIKYGEAMKMEKENPEFKVMTGAGLWVGRIYMNFSNEALAVKEFRQAMYHAINREDVVNKAQKGAAYIGSPGHIQPTSVWYSADIKEYEYSVDTAISLLKEVGMVDTNGNGLVEFGGKDLNFEFIVPEDQIDLGELVKISLEEIGVGVEVKALDSNTVLSLIQEGNFEMAFNGHGAFGGDPVLLKRFVSQDEVVGSTPAMTTQGGENWFNQEFNEVFKRQIVELDEKRRYDEVEKLQQIIAEELPTLTLFYSKTASVYNPKVFEGWFYTKDGVALAVPTVHNKLIFLKGEWKKS